MESNRWFLGSSKLNMLARIPFENVAHAREVRMNIAFHVRFVYIGLIWFGVWQTDEVLFKQSGCHMKRCNCRYSESESWLMFAFHVWWKYDSSMRFFCIRDFLHFPMTYCAFWKLWIELIREYKIVIMYETVTEILRNYFYGTNRKQCGER